MTDVLVRPVAPAEADAIARVHVRSWQAAYRGRIPNRLLDALSVKERAAMWRNWLAAEPALRVWIAEAEGALVGFVAAGPDEEEAGVAQVHAIYVLPEWFGRGAGGLLLRRAEDELRAAGFGEVVLWVLGTNERARRFYERAGWTPDGGSKLEDWGGVELHEVRYRRALGSASGPGASGTLSRR